MADIFISYASEDRSRVEPLAKALEDQGWSVFWDFKIPVGKTWRPAITEELKAARCAVVVWSSTSINSDWVHEEAEEAQERKILVPTIIDKVKPPLGFRRVQAARLMKWEGEPNHPEFEKLLQSIESIISPVSLNEVKSLEPKSDSITTSESKAIGRIAPNIRKTKIALKFGSAAGIIILLIVGIWWWVSRQQVNEVRKEIGIINRQALELESAIAEINKPEQTEKFSKLRDTLNNQVAALSEQASKVRLGLQLEDIQKRLKQIQIQLDNKEKELIAARKGKIFLAFTPDNASVKILNSHEPFQQGMDLEPGKYHVEVSSEGYKPQDRWIELGPGEKKRINFELEKIIPKVARLFVKTVPEEATVKILNIRPKFVQGMELDAGKYHMQVSSDGYEQQDRWIEMGPGEEKRINFELTPQKIITNSIGMEFVLIPASKFVMGSPPDETGRNDDEKQHEVIISKPFYLQATEVSQGQWKKAMGNNPSTFKDCGDDCPAESVSWDMVQEFISKLNQMESTNKYRLPTEAEWEYACRAETETAYSFKEVDKLGDYAWYFANSGDHTHPVGQKKPNDWRLYDMIGNVWEWCHDWYGDYPSNPVVDPKGSDKGRDRVMRGGSFKWTADSLRSADRYRFDPGSRSIIIGFRVARDL